MEKAENICYNTKVKRYLWKYVCFRIPYQEEVFNVKIIKQNRDKCLHS